MTGVDVVEAYDRAMDAAARLNKVDDVTERIWQLVEASDNAAAQFVRQAVQGRMRATGQAIPMRHSGIS